MRALLALAVVALALAGCAAPAPAAVASVDSPGVRLTCPPPCVVEVTAGGNAFEPSVAIDPLDPRHIVAASMDRQVTGEWVNTHVSFDGGTTWETRRAVGGPTAEPGHENAMDTKMSDPVVSFLLDGTPLFVYQANTRAAYLVEDSNIIFLARSSDGGRTWPERESVAEGRGLHVEEPDLPVSVDSEFVYPDNPWLAVGPDGTLLMAWTSYETTSSPVATTWEGPLMFASSTDGGRTWAAPAPVDDRPGRFFQGAFPLIGSDGAWHVGYSDRDTRELILATSRDRGASWEIRELGHRAYAPFLKAGPISGGERIWLSSSMLADHEGRIEFPGLMWSDDAGTTWSQPVALDRPQPQGDRPLPALDVAPDGTAYVGWFHHLESTVELRLMAFEDDVAGPMLVVAGGMPGGGRDVGDYFGLAAHAGGAVAVYTAVVEGTRNVYSAAATASRGS